MPVLISTVLCVLSNQIVPIFWESSFRHFSTKHFAISVESKATKTDRRFRSHFCLHPSHLFVLGRRIQIQHKYFSARLQSISKLLWYYLQIYWNYFILPSVGYCVFVALLFSRNRMMIKVLRRKLNRKFGRDHKIEMNLQSSEANHGVCNENNNLP
jgi:hypothetical protein